MTALATIQKSSNPFMLARIEQPTVRDILRSGNPLLEKGAKEMLVDIITMIEMTAGSQKMTGTEKGLVAVALFQDLCERFPDLTIQEVQLAFKNGVRKDYGEYYGINLVTFNLWLKAFQADEKRAEVILEYQRLLEQQQVKEPTAEEKQRMNKESTERMIAKYRSGEMSAKQLEYFRGFCIGYYENVPSPDEWELARITKRAENTLRARMEAEKSQLTSLVERAQFDLRWSGSNLLENEIKYLVVTSHFDKK